MVFGARGDDDWEIPVKRILNRPQGKRPSIERVFEYFEYRDGKLFWKKNNRRRHAGTIAGSNQFAGKGRRYSQITLDCIPVPATHVIWLLHHGAWPEHGKVIDHINGDTLDNRIENLRMCSYRANATNRSNHREGKLPGAWQNKSPQMRTERWVGEIWVNGKKKSLGSFATELEAHQAYLKALAEIESGVAK